VLASGRFILGPEVAALEAELAALCGVTHGVGVNSGTDALVLALKAVGVQPGDEVITSAFSFVASASAALMVGARPVFVDIVPSTYNLDPALVEKAVTSRTRAIVAVHLYGQPAAMDAISDIARARGIAVVEDAAQAVGATYAGRPAGS
jgi:dTDP-4-amino-4,6-dideoxygalactose transaminase